SYSGVSGASCVVPQHLTGSNEGWPPRHGDIRLPIHWPPRSGYLASSNAHAPLGAVHTIAASAAAIIVARSSITVLPRIRYLLSKYRRSGGCWPLLAGISNPSALRK